MRKFSLRNVHIVMLLFLFGAGLNFSDLPKVEARYKSSSDTNTTIFDYIENRRRENRANALTDEQIELIRDINDFRNNMPYTLDENSPAPAAFVGEDMTYDLETGEFVAKGKVDVIQIEGYRFQSSETVSGNIKTQDVKVDGKAHILQINPNSPRVTLDGYNAVYNYGKKTGKMDAGKGKAGEYYISGKQFEFYPDHIVIHDATQTKCGAKKPDYHVSADRMEIWPEQIIRMYKVKLWIKGTVVGKKDYEERTLNDPGNSYFPKVGYDKDHGFYLEDTFEVPIRPHLKGVINAHIETKNGIRSNAEIHYVNRDFAAMLLYGYYNDDNIINDTSEWLRKSPSLDLIYMKHFATLPLSYKFEYEIGRWRSENVSSLHRIGEVALYHDPIVLDNKYILFLSTSYKITRDNVENKNTGENEVRGMNYHAMLLREFDDRFAAFVGYEYQKNNSRNSLFSYGVDSYSKKFEAGISYRLTDKDRFVIGLKQNVENGEIADVDYYWYRDLHCSTAVLRWRQKKHRIEAHWNFTPW